MNADIKSRLALASRIVDAIDRSGKYDASIGYVGRSVASLTDSALRIEVKRLGQIGGKGKSVSLGHVIVNLEGAVELAVPAQYRDEVAALVKDAG